MINMQFLKGFLEFIFVIGLFIIVFKKKIKSFIPEIKKDYKQFKGFSVPKKILTIIYLIISIVAMFWLVTAAFYLLFLIPMIIMWLLGSENIKFFNVLSSNNLQIFDVSYFTTGDLIFVVKSIVIIVLLLFLMRILQRIDKKLL